MAAEKEVGVVEVSGAPEDQLKIRVKPAGKCKDPRLSKAFQQKHVALVCHVHPFLPLWHYEWIRFVNHGKLSCGISVSKYLQSPSQRV
jgi:hypothetical protein